MRRQVTAVVTRDGDAWVAHCPGLDIASQGSSPDEARTNLIEAIELFFECASAEEKARRLAEPALVTELEVTVG